MTIKDLVKILQSYKDENVQVYISGDPEGNDIRTIQEVATTELEKTNNDGTFDAIVIWPTDEIVNQ